MYENRKGIEMSTGNKLPVVSRFFQTNLYLDKKSKKPCYFSKQKRLPIHNLNFSNLKKIINSEDTHGEKDRAKPNLAQSSYLNPIRANMKDGV